MKIVTVLRSSQEYKKDYVHTIHDQCLKYASNSEFICISDDPDVPGYVPMKHNWPKWWGKIEAFTIEGPVLFLDLDTVIVDDIDYLDDVIRQREFMCLRDFYKNPRMVRTVASGIMTWKGDMSYVYKKFLEDPEGYMEKCITERWFGDGGFIEMTVDNPIYLQDVIPGAIVSYKAHCKNGVPKGADIVAFHGKPRPWEVKFP